MIVPRYWAEGKLLRRNAGKQVTMRRFGWSDDSQEDAQKMADTRTEESLQRYLSGERLAKYEPKMAYNGADSVPIREEIVDRRGETILTRNSYGGLCPNTPDVFFIGADFGDHKPFRYLTRALFVFFLAVAAAVILSGGKALLAAHRSSPRSYSLR
jgi:hypothetical protein